MNDDNQDNRPQLPSFLFSKFALKYIVLPVLGACLIAGTIYMIMNAAVAGVGVASYALNQVKEAATTFVDAANYVGETGLQGIKDIWTGKYSYNHRLKSYWPIIAQICDKHSKDIGITIDPLFIGDIILQEAKVNKKTNELDPTFVNSAGTATGLMQITRDTWRGYCKNYSFDHAVEADKNIDCGVTIIATYLKKYKDYAIAAHKYHGGEGSIPGDVGVNPKEPNWKYTEVVMNRYADMRAKFKTGLS